MASQSSEDRSEFVKKPPSGRTLVGAAVALALYAASQPASADSQVLQAQGSGQPSELKEVIVTATRRSLTLEEVPYSISAIDAEQIAATGVTDIASLTSQVPGLSIYDLGAQASGYVFPIIRGLNASPLSGGFRTFEQAPVGTYIGNSPVSGYFQLDDLQRVEVLKGPQGTLYGAGSLGGAIRIIPNAPELDRFSGNVEASVGDVSHSGEPSYSTRAMVNVPIGDTLAIRVAGKYAYDPGFIDVYGLLARPGSPVSGIPALADPGDPVGSPGIFSGKKDWNDQRTFTGRGSLLWQPTQRFHAELAITYANLNGDGSRSSDPEFPGGPYPIDPRVAFPQGGNYQTFSAIDQPYRRKTSLESLDLSFDAGFATVSSTSSYFRTNGSTVTDGTYGTAAINGSLNLPGFAQYYTGNPINPRFVSPTLFTDDSRTFTEEVRLVSNAAPDNIFDYVLGVFYEDEVSKGESDLSVPGSPEYAEAEGCTAPYFVGASFPACSVVTAPGDIRFFQSDKQDFQDRSVFGEFTWHVFEHGQATFGGRHFDQSFSDEQAYFVYFADILLPPHSRSTPASKNTWKVNFAYEYAPDQHAYALWSQGFRRGGANALPTAGVFAESPVLQTYASDSVNNYELGLKGQVSNHLKYAIDVFDMEWDNPQVGGSTPVGNSAVWNAKKARSRGFEFDVTSPLFVQGLSITVGGAYVDATFTENYQYKNVDLGGSIFGMAGQQLPGSSKVSAATTINYERTLVPGYLLNASVNNTYRSLMFLSTFPSFGQPAPLPVSSMDIVNASVSLTHGPWRASVNVTNLADKLVIVNPGIAEPSVRNLGYDNNINKPREIDLHLGYSF